ncbi:MAG TPA: amidohydrolase family protein, partial [Thermoanaerobaculia bacterium]|nr:amidohydrolase family protein [Thermoanaerobaculia bacterium]
MQIPRSFALCSAQDDAGSIMRTILVLVLALGVSAEAADFDLIIRGAQIVDGSGSPWYRADVAIKGDSIAAISPRIEGSAMREIKAGGRVVSPGFIDLHTHARRGLIENPGAENYIRQGVTTIFEGPDGGSPVPLSDFLKRVAEAKTAPNVAMFIGHGSVREKVIGNTDRKATPAELEQMRELVRQGMRDGAFGLSTGLFYTPGSFAPIEEVIDLARVAGESGGIHISHVRNEAAGIVDSVRETIRIGEEGKLPTQITHHKVMGLTNAGK